MIKDLKDVVVDADELLNELANSTADEFAATRIRLEDRLEKARAGLADARVAAFHKLGAAAEATREYACENPWKAFGLPIAAGLIVALLLSRR